MQPFLVCEVCWSVSGIAMCFKTVACESSLSDITALLDSILLSSGVPVSLARFWCRGEDAAWVHQRRRLVDSNAETVIGEKLFQTRMLLVSTCGGISQQTVQG